MPRHASRMQSGSWAMRRDSGSMRTVSRAHIERLIGGYVERIPSFHVRIEDAEPCSEHTDGVEGEAERVFCSFEERMGDSEHGGKLVIASKPGQGRRGRIANPRPPRDGRC